MIEREHKLPLTRQSQIFELSRSSLYYKAVPVNVRDLEIMKLIDEIHLKYPFYGSRSIRDELRGLGYEIGRGRWLDNVFVERLWRSVKYEDVYLKAYDSIPSVRKGLKKYFEFYNCKRRHQGLDRKTPNNVYWSILPQKQVVA